MKLGCENLLRRHEILDQLKSRNFDVAIVEPLSVCGLGLAKKLEIGKTILASSCAYYDYLFRHIGEPDVHSYLPSLMSTTGDVMTTFERLENHRVAEVCDFFSRIFEIIVLKFNIHDVTGTNF